MWLLRYSHAVRPWASHLGVSESQDGDKALVLFRWDAVEAKSLGLWLIHGHCSLWLLLKISPFLTPKRPTNVAPYFSSPGLALTLSSVLQAPAFHRSRGAFILTWPRPPDGKSRDEAATAAWCPPVREEHFLCRKGLTCMKTTNPGRYCCSPILWIGNWDVREKLSKQRQTIHRGKNPNCPPSLGKVARIHKPQGKQTALALRHPSSPVTLANGSEGSSFQWWQECGKSGGHRPCETA